MPRHLVVEADGGSRGNPGPAAYGTVVRDGETGEVLVERAESIGVASNNVAEYRGLIAGLEEAHRIDSEARIDVRLDSKLIVEQMSGRWKIKHPDMRALALRARDVHDMSAVSWTWVPRSQNAHADRLLNDVLDGKPAGQGSESLADERTRRPLLRPAALGEPTTLVLLRHGETPLTVQRRFSGRGGQDVGLTDAGRRQVERAAAMIERRAGADRPTAVVASPLLRTQESARIVADRVGLDVETLDDLAEMSFGDWDGLTFGEARKRDERFFDAWLSDPTIAPPGGESLVDLAGRVARARDQLVERFESQTVLLVSHAMPVKSVVVLALGAPVSSVHQVDVAPASLSEVAYFSDGRPSLRGLGLR